MTRGEALSLFFTVLSTIQQPAQQPQFYSVKAILEKVKKNRPFQRNRRLSVVRPVRFERMAFGVGAVLCEVFASQRLLKSAVHQHFVWFWYVFCTCWDCRYSVAVASQQPQWRWLFFERWQENLDLLAVFGLLLAEEPLQQAVILFCLRGIQRMIIFCFAAVIYHKGV